VVAPLGSILNPEFPAPSGARGITGFRVIDCMFGALSQAVPDRVPADGSGGSTLPTIAGYRAGKPFVFCETFMGTWGGTQDHDGPSGVPHMGANQSNVPIEMIETDYPLRVEEYGFVADTGGPGRNRGGIAITRQYRLLCDKASLNVRSDKRKFPPHGLYGGKPGSPSINIINPGNHSRILPVLMTEVEPLVRGDVYRHVMSGGGGYGDPLTRETDRVLKDVIEEKVSIAHAAAEYGVVILPGDPPTVDEEATRRCRQRLRTLAAAAEHQREAVG
jgi:N-methylhydantoinase B